MDNGQRISNLETIVNGLNTTVNDLNTTVNLLNQKVNDLNTAVSGLNTTVNGLESNVNGLNTTVNNIENRFEALENKSWHFNGDFSLSPTNTNVTFNTQGEAWRMSYTFNGASVTGIQIVYNLRVYDTKGNIIGGLNGIELADLKNSGSGILYIPYEQGTYSVEIRGITGSYTFTFEVQSYY